MSEHLSKQTIERYRHRELSAAELFALDDHVVVCALCQAETLNNEKSSVAIGQAISALQAESEWEDLHLEYQQLSDYVDDAVNEVERELADSHLEFCQTCRVELQELQTMKATLAELPAPQYSPGKTPNPWRRFSAWWQVPTIRKAVQVAAVIALGVTAVWIIVFYSRQPLEEARKQSSQPDRQDTTAANSSSLDQSASETTKPKFEPEEPNQVRPVADLIDGDRHIMLSGDDKLLGLESATTQTQSHVISALKSGRVGPPSFMAELKGRSGSLMGAASSEYGLLNPFATAVESRTPTFRWRSIDGAESYEVTIYGNDAKKIVASGPLTETKWRVNVPLERGRIFTWQVRANKKGAEILMPPPAAPEAKFKVIDAAKVEELTQIRRSNPHSHLLLGLAYANAGLLDDSARELQRLVAANPKSSVAKSLLRSVEAQKRSR